MKTPIQKRSTKKSSTSSLTTVEDYFAAVHGPAREILTKLRATIRSVVPAGATEVISYRMPAFKGKKIIVWYAAFAKHCSLFPGGEVIDQMKDDLKDFVTSKGTIQFPIDKPLPTALVKKVIKRRLEQLH
jgi:uncharacterized protein YdhG (YjbR/CyaY superfamily)